AGLADREHGALAADVDDHALVALVEVERFARRMLVIPLQAAVVRIQRERRARVQRAVERGVAAARGHPRLRLRDAPVGRVEIGVVAARDPRVAAGAIDILNIAPGVAARCAGRRDGREFPEPVAVVGVVGADEALFLAELRAAAHALQYFAADDERTARDLETTLGAIADHGFPNDLAR